MTDVGPLEGARHKSLEKCYWIFSNFSLGGIFSTTDGKNMTTINNFYVKKRPSCLKVGTPISQGWGSWKPTSAPTTNSWSEKYRCSVVLDSLLCGLCLSSLPGAPISLSDINTTSQFSRREVWMKSLGPLEWFVDYLLGWLGSLWESKASQLMAVKPC